MYKKMLISIIHSLYWNQETLVWLHLRKEHFPLKRKNNVRPRSKTPSKVVERVGDSAYRLELLADVEVLAAFNIGDLSPYLSKDEHKEFRVNSFQEERMMQEHPCEH